MFKSVKYNRTTWSLLIILAISFFAFDAKAAEWHTYFTAESFSYNESTAIGSLLDKFQSDSLSSGDIFFTYNRAEMGSSYRLGRFEVGVHYIGRYDYLIEYSQDAIQLLYWSGNDISADRTREYDIFMKVNRVSSTGVGASLGFYPSDNMNLGLKAYRLSTASLLLGSISGAMRQSQGQLIYQDLSLDYVYDEDIVFDRAVKEPAGNGVSLDIDLSWKINAVWNTSISLKDAYSRLTWRQVPSTIAKQNNTPVKFNEDGSIDVSPSLAGDTNPRNAVQRLPKKIFALVSYQHNNIGYTISGLRIKSLDFWQTSLQYVVKQHRYHIGYLPVQKGIEVSYANNWFNINLVTDNFNFRKAKLTGIMFGFHLVI